MTKDLLYDQDDEILDEIDQYISKNYALDGIGLSDDVQEEDKHANDHELNTKEIDSNWGTKKSAYYVNENESKKRSKKQSELDLQIELEEAKRLKKQINEHSKHKNLDFEELSSDSSSEFTDSVISNNAENDMKILSKKEDSKLTHSEDKHKEYAEKYLQLYEKLIDEVDDILNIVYNYTKENPCSVPNQFSEFVKFKIFFNSLYALNINLALQFLNQKNLNDHQINERLMRFDNLYNAIKHYETRVSNYKDICHKICSCLRKHQLFSIDMNEEDLREQGDKLDKKSHANNLVKETKKSKRKSKTSNPRVLKKQRLIKKAAKWQTVVPKMRKQDRDYEGEEFGIRKNALRSTKLS